MALAKVTIEALTRMASVLKQGAEDILSSKSEMDRELDSFEWDDHVAITFKGEYYENLKPITDTLLPDIKSYLSYLESLSIHVYEFTDVAHGRYYRSEQIIYPHPSGSASDTVRINTTPKTDSFPDSLDSANTNSEKIDQNEFEDPLNLVNTDSEKMGQSEFADPLDLIDTGPQVPPPEVFKTDNTTMRIAASGILAAMAAGGLVLGGKEMHNMIGEEADKIFEKKYNKSLNEIGLDMGIGNPKAKGYYDDYNSILEELEKEVTDGYQPISESSMIETQPVIDADFESRISDMSKESLEYLNQRYQDYSDLSRMADYSYRDGTQLPEGWEDVGRQNPKFQRIINDIDNNGGKSSGLKFSVLKKAGEDKYVIAFAGTDFPKEWMNLSQDKEFIKDAWADGHGMFSQDEEQIKLAKQAVFRLCKEGGIPLENMEFTGHSLGGRLASEMSVQYARPATTFNAAGVSEETRKQYEYLMAHSKNHYTGVVNIVTEHDFLTNLQSMGSGAKNEYIAALPKEEIKIIHETISGTLSSTEGKVAKKALDVVGPGASRVIDGVDTAFTWADRFNEYYNRDYRALGGTVVLADGKSGISSEAHSINLVSDLLDQRKGSVSNKLKTIGHWEGTSPSWKENTSIPLPKIEKR